MDDDPRREVLARDLQALVGWPTPSKAAALLELRALVLQRYPAVTVSQQQVFERQWQLINEALLRLRGDYVLGVGSSTFATIRGTAVRRALNKLFWLDASAGRRPNHRARREWAILELGLNCTVDYWRRHGPELALMRVLAEALLEPNASELEQRRRVQVVETMDLTYRFDEERRLVQVDTTATFRSLMDQADGATARFVGEADPRLQYHLRGITGGDLVSAGPPPGMPSPLVVVVQGPPVLKGQSYAVGSSFAVDPGILTDRVSTDCTLELGGNLRLLFHPAAVPGDVRFFWDAVSLEEGIIAAAKRPSATAVGTTSYHLQFGPVRQGRRVGAFWNW